MEFVQGTSYEHLQKWVDGIFEDHYGETPLEYFYFEATENKKRLAVVTGKVFAGWVFVTDLVVIKAKNFQGVGSSLLKKAEEFGKSKGCIGSILTTISYQFPEFYKKYGYESYAELEPYFGQHKRIYMKKVF